MKKSNASLKERLSDWKDWDGVAYEIGVCLGLWNDFGGPPGTDCWNGVKWVMWSDNALGSAIYNFMEGLAEAGMLERREEPDIAYRWNKKYKELD